MFSHHNSTGRCAQTASLQRSAFASCSGSPPLLLCVWLLRASRRLPAPFLRLRVPCWCSSCARLRQRFLLHLHARYKPGRRLLSRVTLQPKPWHHPSPACHSSGPSRLYVDAWGSRFHLPDCCRQSCSRRSRSAWFSSQCHREHPWLYRRVHGRASFRSAISTRPTRCPASSPGEHLQQQQFFSFQNLRNLLLSLFPLHNSPVGEEIWRDRTTSS